MRVWHLYSNRLNRVNHEEIHSCEHLTKTINANSFLTLHVLHRTLLKRHPTTGTSNLRESHRATQYVILINICFLKLETYWHYYSLSPFNLIHPAHCSCEPCMLRNNRFL